MLTFYHAPWSRSSSILWLLEELKIPYELEMIDIRARTGVPESYRTIQPSKKVPAIVHDGQVVTERAAITIYLADRFSQTGLAPAINDPDRATYLTALVYCDAVFDPAICAQVQRLDYTSNEYPFGTFADMLAYIERRLENHPFAAGERFTAADTQLGSGINYTMNILRALPEKQVFKDYLARLESRPAYRKAQQLDMELAASVPFFSGQGS
ncbi:glutathione S-transferase family protein [Nitratireductor kimnyeongensis]|uniref:Glutathione S-transferase family protein n=1 Tax=Nitratireductor kimnyeongensis TaxID=430679 RepID=A0ABW0TBR3_9HYPH|nr:glutathione S-transferase family protein [Nitratireductor kimnyeongensis]QZZ35522.1 glutathione S-transferase family protein [Nitratireductor kimnyeongensis]